MSTALFVSSAENQHLIKPKSTNSNPKQWSTIQLLSICLLVLIISVLLSNIDRIIDLFSSNSAKDEVDSFNIDILIIGGGATGMFELNFLREAYPNKKILLIEKQNYVGGRTLSSIITYNNKKITTEFGARRTRYDPLMWKILYYLNLCDDLVFFFQNTSISQTPIKYFRNTIISNITNSDDIYHFTELDKTFLINDTNPFVIIYDDILNENNDDNEPQSLQEWIEKFYQSNWTLNNIPIIQYSAKTALTNYLKLSNEYINAKFDELQSFNSPEMSLIRLLALRFARLNYVNVTEEDELYDNSLRTLKYGYMSIINGFYKNIMINTYNEYDLEFDPIWLNTKLIGIDYGNNNKYKYSVKIEHVHQNISYINAENVILSVDIMNLKKLVPDLVPIRDELQYGMDKGNNSDIDSSCFPWIDCLTVSVKLYKINLIYDILDKELAVYLESKSQSQTDLEINEFTAFESISTNDTLTLIQLYPKLETESIYWDQLQGIGEKYEINENLTVNNIESMLIASKILVNTALIQIENLLSLSINNYSLGLPLAAFVKPFGINESDVDGLNDWKYNLNIPSIAEWLQRPNKNENIFITNNEYHAIIDQNNQLSAFQAGIKLITQHFNISDPFENSPKCHPP